MPSSSLSWVLGPTSAPAPLPERAQEVYEAISPKLTGYVLEPPRVGGSNSPFTMTPNVVVSDDAAFNAAHPGDESAARAEYMVQVLREGIVGSGPAGAVVIADAIFGWSKNQGGVQDGRQIPFQRFDYAGQDQRFRLLQGAPREFVGTLAVDANANRLVVTYVPQLRDFGSFPVRVSVGSGSGDTFAVSLVDVFGVPAPGSVEMDATGALNWHAADVAERLGQAVYYQRQSFYKFDETDGVVGTVGALAILNPIPGPGQMPAIRVGERTHLNPVQRASEQEFASNPAAGTVEWAADTGRLKFSAADTAALSGQPVIYDGVLLGHFQVPKVTVGLAQGTPCGALVPVPSEASDVHFRIAGLIQFERTVFVDAFDAGRRGEVQIRKSDGAVQLAAVDRVSHAGLVVEAILPDVPVEHGISLRLFRSPLNANGVGAAKDVTGAYTVERATLAEPIVAQPFVFLPALPREDEPVTVAVEQGTGSFVGSLGRLDGESPPVGFGYVLDLAARQLSYAERKSEILPESATPYGSVQLPGAPVLQTGLLLEIESAAGAGDFAALVEDRDFTIDRGSGVVTMLGTQGYRVVAGVATSVAGSRIEVAEDLGVAGVQSGDSFVVRSGWAKGLYTVVEVETFAVLVSPALLGGMGPVEYEILRGKEVLADRFFREVPSVDVETRIERVQALGLTSNEPRLRINRSLAHRVRFRFDRVDFSTSVVVRESSADFSALARGAVEVDASTGELNFSADDVASGAIVSCVLTLLPGVDYRLQPALGFIEFSERMLEGDEILLRYATAQSDGTARVVEEVGAFLIAKERVQEHSEPTTRLRFNPKGRRLASVPAPRAFRGGRPQSASRVRFDLAESTLQFLPDAQVTSVLPHGPVVSPHESVYVDYYVTEALGGERNLTVSQPPVKMPEVRMLPVAPLDAQVEVPYTAFSIEGDRTADFPPGLLEVDGADVYLVSDSTFDGIVTTVNLDQTEPQVFRTVVSSQSTFRVSSGVVRRFASGMASPSYFVADDVGFDVVARGSKQLKVVGDQSRVYASGTIVAFTAPGYQDYYKVEGATFDGDSERTVVVLASGVVRQYGSSAMLSRSVRPILGSSVASAMTNWPPVSSLPVTLYRKREGMPGELLEVGRQCTLDGSGRVTLSESLSPNEEIGILYSGAVRVEARRRIRASWNFTMVPSIENGLLGQVLRIDYTTYSPDTFFWRVETVSNYRAELVRELEERSKAANPSQGPILENAKETPLHEQGRASLFFEEGDLANQDIVARNTLQFYNNVINSLESYLEGWDGRVVGDHEGRFLFDGKIDNPVRTHFALATNQIDDLIQVFGTTTKRAFEAAAYSRFYPTQKVKFGMAGDPTGLATGDPILDLEEKSLKAVLSVRTRAPWAVTTASAPVGASVLQVDHARGDAYLLRPGLDVAPQLKVAITARDGTVLVSDESPVVVASTTATSVTFTAPLTVGVPKGATVRMSTQDDVYDERFRLGVDVGVDLDAGYLTHVASEDVPGIFLPNSSPTAGMALDAVLQVVATSTAPARFPALDGGTTDDDGNRRFPVLGVGGGEADAIATEVALIDGASGALKAIVAPSFVGAGTVTSATTIAHATAWPAPAPKVGDLVRIVTGGAAGVSDFHRVTVVGTSTLTLEPGFTFSSGAVTFEVTTGPVIASGAGTVSPATVLTHAEGDFLAKGVKPGFTVVAVSGALAGQRRQVSGVSPTQITVDGAFSTTGAIGYEVVNSLATYGGPSASLQDEWTDALVEQLRALEGQDLIDLSDRIVAQQTGSQTVTVSGIDMGAFSSLLVFVAVEEAEDCSLASVTFSGSPLPALHATAASEDLGLHVYLGQGLSGSGNLVVTATSAAPAMKVFALKLSALRQVSSVAVASAGTAPATVTTSGISSIEAGDLVVSFVCSAATANQFYSLEGYETLIPRFDGQGLSAMLTATRVATADQPIEKTFNVTGTWGRIQAATVVLTKDPGADPIAGRPISERVALTRFIEAALLADFIPGEALVEADAALAGVEAAIVSAGNLLLRQECPMAVYRNATTLDSSFTSVSGRLVMSGARARPISALNIREAVIEARAATSGANLEDILSSGRLYDGRFAWIDSRINLETGILPRKDRAVNNRKRALETIVKNLTRLRALSE